MFALPTSTLSCVTYSTDTGTVNDGCESCSSSSLSAARGCVLYSTDGTTITTCSQATDGNKPLVTSCYVGQFTGTSSPSITTCTSTDYDEFCKVSIFLFLNIIF